MLESELFCYLILNCVLSVSIKQYLWFGYLAVNINMRESAIFREFVSIFAFFEFKGKSIWNRCSIQNPFFLRYFVVTQDTGMFEYPCKNSFVNRCQSMKGECERWLIYNFGNVCSSLVCFLFFIIFWSSCCLWLVISIDEFLYLFNGNVPLNMLCGSFVQVLRCF